MGPDWFTVVAQVINFLILVALLKRFLYGPIVRAMDHREGEIAARLASAVEKTLLAEKERERLAALTLELSETREALLVNARNEAAGVHRELLEKAREEVEQSKAQWQNSLMREQESLVRSLYRHICEEACTIVRRIVSDMADTSFQEQMICCLERRIAALTEGDRAALADEFRSADHDIVITSSAAMRPEDRAKLLGVLNSLILPTSEDSGQCAVLTEDKVHFVLDADLLCGIELRVGGRSMAWNLAAYLDGLEQRLLAATGTDLAMDPAMKQ